MPHLILMAGDLLIFHQTHDSCTKNSLMFSKSSDSLMIFAQSILDAMTQSLFSLTLQYSLPFLIDLVSQLNINYIAKVRDLKFLF